MKKTIITALVAFILGAAGMYFYQSKKAPEAGVLAEHGHKPPLPFTNITFAEAKELVHQYQTGMGDSTSLAANGIPGKTLTVWFGMATINSLLEAIQDKNGDGVRIYLARYGKNYKGSSSPSRNRDYSNAITLVMAPTRKDSLNDTTVYHWDIVDSLGTQNVAFALSPEDQNKGELCPPPSNCSLTGAVLLSNVVSAAKKNVKKK